MIDGHTDRGKAPTGKIENFLGLVVTLDRLATSRKHKKKGQEMVTFMAQSAFSIFRNRRNIRIAMIMAKKFAQKAKKASGKAFSSIFVKGNRIRSALTVTAFGEGIYYLLDSKGAIKEFGIPNIAADIDFEDIKDRGNSIDINDLDIMDDFEITKDMKFTELAKKVITFTGNNGLSSYNFFEKLSYLEEIGFKGALSKLSKKPEIKEALRFSKAIYLLANTNLKMNFHHHDNTIIVSLYNEKQITELHDNFDFEMATTRDLKFGVKTAIINLVYEDSNIVDDVYNSGVSQDSINSMFSNINGQLRVEPNNVCFINKEARGKLFSDKKARNEVGAITGFVRDSSKMSFLPTTLHLEAIDRFFDICLGELVEVLDNKELSMSRENKSKLVSKFFDHQGKEKWKEGVKDFKRESSLKLLNMISEIKNARMHYANVSSLSKKRLADSFFLDFMTIDERKIEAFKAIVEEYERNDIEYNPKGVLLLINTWIETMDFIKGDVNETLETLEVLSKIMIPLSEFRRYYENSDVNWVQEAAELQASKLVITDGKTANGKLATLAIIKVLTDLILASSKGKRIADVSLAIKNGLVGSSVKTKNLEKLIDLTTKLVEGLRTVYSVAIPAIEAKSSEVFKENKKIENQNLDDEATQKMIQSIIEAS